LKVFLSCLRSSDTKTIIARPKESVVRPFLVFYRSTCPGIHNGDTATFSAAYQVIPRQVSTQANPLPAVNRTER
jgi:hypothetical protein